MVSAQPATERGGSTRRRLHYCTATTVSCVAAATVACGAVVLQVTLPAALAQVYHEPAAANCTFTVEAAVGAIVNAT